MENKYNNWEDLICYKDKKIVDWSKNIGAVLYFVYNTAFHYLKIIEDYGSNGKSHYLKIEFDNGIIRDMRTDHLKQLAFSKIYPKDTHKYKIGFEINGLKIINSFVKKRNLYNWNQNMYTVRCLKDGYEFDIIEYDIDQKRGCPVCANRKIIPGINDLATTDSWMTKYFKNKNETLLYSSKSRKEVCLKCPTCGKEETKTIEVLHRYGFSCKFCSDKISYPNKFMISLLMQLENNGVISNYQREYGTEWSRPYKYDNYFNIGNNKFIIEMDGGLGHGKVKYGSNEKDTVGFERDIIKNNLAKEHGIQLFRIDCDYPNMRERFAYIKDNILSSLSHLFDFSVVNWEECEKFCGGNLLEEICLKYNSGMTRQELCKEYNYITNSTIGNYLHIGTRCGLCNYRPTFSKKYRYIYLIKDDSILEKTRSISEMIMLLKTKYDLDSNYSGISKNINMNIPYKNKYIFKADLL